MGQWKQVHSWGVPKVMKISSFMDSVKSPELAKRFSSNIPKTVDEMMRRVDEFVRAEEAYARTELPPGESRDIHRRLSFPTGPRDVHQRLTFPTSTRNDRDNRSSQRRDYKGNDHKNPYKIRDNRHRDYRAPYPQRDQANKTVPVLSLDSLIKCPKEILATETQLQLPAPRPVANPLRTGDPDKYCDYHQDKGHHTNDCIQLRKQLEIAFESGRLNHLMKDLRQRVGRGQGRNPPLPPKGSHRMMQSDEPLIIEAEVEGYLVRRVYWDEGSSVEVSVLNIALKTCSYEGEGQAKWKQGKGTPGGFARRRFGGDSRWGNRFGGLREGKQILTEKQPKVHEAGQPDEGADLTEQILVNPSFPDQIVTIGGGLSSVCKNQLKTLLINNMEVFAWEPADMTGVPRRIIEHSLNVNPSLEPFCQKRRTFSPEKSEAVTNEVAEWARAGIVRPVKYPTYISNPVLVKKCDGSWRMWVSSTRCSLESYKRVLQIQMAREDEEKTAFYTEQGTYCYMKMPFGLKNAGATYQRLVDSTFQSQIGRNLEAYVDDMKKDKFFGIHGHIGRNQGQPQKDKGHIGSHLSKNIEGNAKSQWKASFVKSVPGQESQEYNEEEQRLNLDLLQERREAAAIREAKYKTKMEQYYNKRVRPAGFRPGEFVYRRNEASRMENEGKLGPNWEGPYRVTEAFENGSYKLQTMEDKVVPRTWHAVNLRKCYL
ncbi:hypothetical protein Tco_1201559 [Tanacetum coccineum]